MIFSETPLPGSYVIEPKPYEDERGWFARFYCKEEFEKIGHHKEWVQLNHSVTYQKGSIRGMHFQVAPHREIKMVKCIAGIVFDVIIDLRTQLLADLDPSPLPVLRVLLDQEPLTIGVELGVQLDDRAADGQQAGAEVEVLDP